LAYHNKDPLAVADIFELLIFKRIVVIRRRRRNCATAFAFPISCRVLCDDYVMG